MVDKQGKEAVKTGSWLESTIASMLNNKAFVELSEEERKMFQQSDGDITRYSGRWFTQQVRTERNIYGAMHRSDFFLVEPKHYPDGLVIEAKWQGAAGSIDEKYVFTVLSMLKMRTKSIIVIDGGGARLCAIQWMKGEARKSKGKLEVMTLSEFMAMVGSKF